MPNLTHAVFDAVTGETISEHPDASSAFAAASKIGGAPYGYVVGPIGDPPKDIPKHKERSSPGKTDEDGPGLFD